MNRVEKHFELAREQYAELGVDVDSALHALQRVSLSLHCWQGDDVGGFETPDAELSGGGIQTTGNYPGKARNPEELRSDLDMAFSQIPGKHKLNLHSIYGEFGGKRIDRDAFDIEHFSGWLDWAKAAKRGLDFNASCFSHPNAADGFTLSHPNADIRNFWKNHVNRCREISAEFGRATGITSVHNLWIPDGTKDTTVDRRVYRENLKQSLDEIYADRFSPAVMRDSVECKLFGIGSESYVVGSHEFYLAYTLKNDLMLCLDMGHFHPTESVADKISALSLFQNNLLLHVSRGVRWDSDHVVINNDDLRSLAEEIVRSDMLEKAFIALDFFDASINRVGAWVIGARATLKALLTALLEPRELLMKYEREGNGFARLQTLEQLKSMPFGAIWDYYCKKSGTGIESRVVANITEYEANVLSERS